MGRMKKAAAAVGIYAVTFLLLYTQFLYSWDKALTDRLFQRGSVPDPHIFIIAVDEDTLDALGAMGGWGRDVYGELLELLHSDGEGGPAVVGFDILFAEAVDPRGDQAFAKACESAGNVVTAMNLVFREMPEREENGRVTYNPYYIEDCNFPYEALAQAAESGFVNTVVDRDGFVRRAMAQIAYRGEVLESFDMAVYRKYMDFCGQEAVMPPVDGKALFSFSYSSRPGGYSVISLCDVLDGTVNPAIFKNGIVLVGAYAAGMQDSYAPAIAHGQQMYGVEVHANIINALLEGRTQREVPLLPYSLCAGILPAALFLLLKKARPVRNTLVTVGFILFSLVFCVAAFSFGVIVPIIILPFMMSGLYLAELLGGYGAEVQRRRGIVRAFKQYVSPELVEDISRKHYMELKLGGEKRNIAVLFVDVRGFTTLSEKLPPEEVVEFLNEYLSITTNAILKNKGTLDKYVGDATMAIFNAPFDLEDYVFCAVQAAWDMQQAAAGLAEKWSGRLGGKAAFGVGIHCGDAVVGNIGCSFRMDYTAIGDAVNTAARLEARAGGGEILVSEAVYRQVKDRVGAVALGDFSLKGKEESVSVYRLESVYKDEKVL